MKSIIFVGVVFVTLITNVMFGVASDGWFRFKCNGWIPFRLTSCSRHCPELFPNGHCERDQGKWKCACRSSERDMNMYSLEEANCIQLVSSGDENPGCATNLCPIGFQKGGRILKENGKWQWYCSAKEFDNDRESKYTLSEAESIYGACNGAKAQGIKACRSLCPEKYNHGDCFLDKEEMILRCGCTLNYKLSDWYGIQESHAIANVCSRTVQNHEGCAQLCPRGFSAGHCFSIARNWVCGCRRENTGVGWYTIPKAREMMKVCNNIIQDRKGCINLCPIGYIMDGKCSNESGQPECHCLKQGSNPRWVTLKEAIYNVDIKNQRRYQHQRLRS